MTLSENLIENIKTTYVPFLITENSEIFSSSDIIPISALLLAVLSLVITSVSNRKTYNLSKHHNELSVRPILNTTLKHDTEANEIVIKIQNNGLGPAIIEKINYSFNNIDSHEFLEILKKIDSNSFLKVKDSIIGEYSNHCISSGQVMIILRHTIKTTYYKDKVIEDLKKIEITMPYRNMYNRHFEFKEKLGVKYNA
jgi:hypothetical protein